LNVLNITYQMFTWLYYGMIKSKFRVDDEDHGINLAQIVPNPKVMRRAKLRSKQRSKANRSL